MTETMKGPNQQSFVDSGHGILVGTIPFGKLQVHTTVINDHAVHLTSSDGKLGSVTVIGPNIVPYLKIHWGALIQFALDAAKGVIEGGSGSASGYGSGSGDGSGRLCIPIVIISIGSDGKPYVSSSDLKCGPIKPE